MPKLKTKSGKVKHYKYTKKGVAAYKKAKNKSKKTQAFRWSMKRTLKRNGWKDTASGKTRFTCEKRTVELKTNKEGNIVVAKVL